MPPDAPCPSAEVLRRSLDLDDPLPEAERRRVEAHVNRCDRGCKEVIEAVLRGATLPLAPGGAGRDPTTKPENSAAAGRPGSVAPGRPPAPPGYEVLEEIGRGGMGVVYKARQLGFNRIVALKMILSGAHAGGDERERFRTEAEAVARLQHPHIVQVYEVGEHEGRPFFSMEFCPGGGLEKRLRGAPLPPGEAAQLVETLARALEAAHRQNVVHRDMKPSNILLAADGAPKVTDFGLAKKLDEAGPTRTGVVMGTPSYMAPEQAAGRSKEVGPATDVYALGAILYECLTGRPPFRGPTDVDTLMQALRDEPVSPRRLQPKTPRDLETACLKSLAKDPARRYATADALAEDLRLFQAGRPIHARPAGPAERLLKWMKRRPAVAALAAAVAFAVLAGLAASWALTAWAFRERDRAEGLLGAARRADRLRVQAQVEELGGAAPEAVPELLAALARDREAVRPRLRELWAGEGGDPRRRMRAGMALLGEDPSPRDALAEWMLEAEDPREVLLVREVLAPQGAALADRLWERAGDATVGIDARFRALAALAAFDPASSRWDRAADNAVEQLLKANPLHLGAWLDALRPVRGRLHHALVEAFRGRDPAPADRRLTAATVLADYAADQPAVLADLACDADADQFKVLRPPLESRRTEALDALTAELSREAPAGESEADRIVRAVRRGNAAAALAALGRPEAAWPVLRHSRTPDARTVLIHGLAPHGAEPGILVDRLGVEQEPSGRAALILALGEYTAERLTLQARASLTPKLLAAYRDDPDPGVHGAIDWLLRQGKEGPVDRPLDWGGRADLEKTDAELSGKPGPAGRRWFVNGQGQTFTAVRGPVEFWMGSPEDEPGHQEGEGLRPRTIGRCFAVAARPVTVGQWEKFLRAMEADHLTVTHYHNKEFAPDLTCPIVGVSWYDAAAYCRWLSEQERLPTKEMVYPSIPEILRCADGRTPLTLPKDHLSRTGYRLPTDAEYEYACRADTATRWYFGGDEGLLPRYAWFVLNSQNRSWPVGQKKPNELGLFDAHGNAWTWCQEGLRPSDVSAADCEDDRDVKDGITRILRGGSFKYQAAMLRAAFREHDRPSYPGETVGVRLARTLPPDHFSVLPPR